MSNLDWAEKEIEIACKKEETNNDELAFFYSKACYESALKAFKCLYEDGHSGTSINFTMQILNRLVDNKPLTPIEESPGIWTEVYDLSDKTLKTYQCTRMSSLFKKVFKDGTIKYSDVNRVNCIDINSDTKCYFHSSLITSIIDDLYPITLPYCPAESWVVETDRFLTDEKNGDFDTIGIFNLTKKGKVDIINKFYKQTSNDSSWIPISFSEYLDRVKIKI